MPNGNASAGERKQDNVVEFKAGARSEYGVTQRDLAEERVLSLEAATILKALEQKRKHIRAALLRGEEVEPGTRCAYLLQISPASFSVQPKPYKKLVVR